MVLGRIYSFWAVRNVCTGSRQCLALKRPRSLLCFCLPFLLQGSRTGKKRKKRSRKILEMNYGACAACKRGIYWNRNTSIHHHGIDALCMN